MVDLLITFVSFEIGTCKSINQLMIYRNFQHLEDLSTLARVGFIGTCEPVCKYKEQGFIVDHVRKGVAFRRGGARAEDPGRPRKTGKVAFCVP
jgi:hypothetical protein